MPEFYVEPMTDRWTCFHCNQAASGKKKLLKCAGCEAITYCSKECQKEDWTRHKWNCVPVMVTEIPGKGRGLVASRDLKMGDLIFIDKPAIKVPMGDNGLPFDSHYMKSLRNQIDSLPSEAKLQFFKLTPPNESLNPDFASYIRNSVDSVSESDAKSFKLFIENSEHISLEQSKWSVLYLNLALVNHSCHPNAARGVLGLGKDVAEDQVRCYELRALKDIAKGEEINFCYLTLPNFQEFGIFPRKKRSEMKKVLLFDCQCLVCLGKIPCQEKNMKKLFELRNKLAPTPSDWKREAGIRARIVDLTLGLDIGHIDDKVDALHKMVYSAHCARDQDLVKKGMTKWKQLTEDTNLECVQRTHDNMDNWLLATKQSSASASKP